jgi:hypothetical protein
MADLAAMYLLGLVSGMAIGAIGAFLALQKGDGWQDVRKGDTKLQRFHKAGIGVGKKKES